jgi:hypothetical protein
LKECAILSPGRLCFLERFPAKACPGLDPGRIPVRVKKTRQNNNQSLRSDSIGTEMAPVKAEGTLWRIMRQSALLAIDNCSDVPLLGAAERFAPRLASFGRDVSVLRAGAGPCNLSSDA